MRELILFLPELPYETAVSLLEDHRQQVNIDLVKLEQDWQATFCQFIGAESKNLPWTRLRIEQFELANNIKTACCCDPVLLQVTHRGAYMLGQNGLMLSQNDAIRIVAQINEKLMRDGEHLYLIDKQAWLFTSEKELSLASIAHNDLVGKDMFNYPYLGDDAQYWQRLTTEIQMLIKQMIDYQDLLAVEVSEMLNVHFYDCISLDSMPDLPFIKNSNLTVLSDNELMISYCEKSLLARKPLSSLSQNKSRSCAVVVFDNERENYEQVLFSVKSAHYNKEFSNVRIICQDAEIRFKHKTLWKKINFAANQLLKKSKIYFDFKI
ncbi:hypothetical protein [Aliikangiella sp. IMCC44632]